MSDPVISQDVPPAGGNSGRLGWLLVLIAVLLAFGLGRLWGRGEHCCGQEAKEPPGAKEAEEVTHKILTEGVADGKWTPEEDAKFLASLGPLGRERREHQLELLAQLVNERKVHLEPPPKPTYKPCFHACEPETGTYGSVPKEMPPATPAPGRSPKQ